MAAACQAIPTLCSMPSASSFYVLDLKSLAVDIGFPFGGMAMYSTFRLLINLYIASFRYFLRVFTSDDLISLLQNHVNIPTHWKEECVNH